MTRFHTSDARQHSSEPVGFSNALMLLAWGLLSAGLFLSLYFNQQYSQFLGASGLFLLGCFGGVAWFIRRGRPPFMLWVVVVFWLWWWLVAQFSQVSYASDTTVWMLFSLPLASISAWGLSVHDRKFKARYQIITACFGFGLAVYACYQFFWLEQAPSATFINKNNFAALEVMLLLLLMGSCFAEPIEKTASLPSAKIFLRLVLIVFLAFVIGLVASLGALLALTIGVVLLIAGAWFLGTRLTRIIALVIAVLSGLLAASLIQTAAFGQKFAVLQAPFESSSGGSRLLIWSGSVEMLGGAFWTGIGPGLYWLLYPKYRLPGDASDGFYAHNDYLQFAIEAGMPGLLLFIALIGVVCWQAFRFFRQTEVSRDRRLEALTLLVGLTAVCLHSLVTFNLYLMPILIVSGIFLGRLAWLTATQCSVIKPCLPTTRWLPVLLVGLTVLVPVSFYGRAIGGGLSLTEAMTASTEKRWQDAANEFQQAITYWPEVDFYYYSLAWVLVQTTGGLEFKAREARIEQALAYLETSKSLNPYRSQAHTVEARIREQLARHTGENDDAQIATAYAAALERDPQNLSARFFYARFLLGNNQIDEGVEMLEGGLKWFFENSALKLNYFRLTAEMRKIRGDVQGYREMMEQVAIVGEKLQPKQVRKKAVPDR